MSKKRRETSAPIRQSQQNWGPPIPNWLSSLIIALVGILVYSNTLGSSFHFDDESSITANAAIKNLADLKAIWRFSPARFLTYLSFAINYHFGGLNVLGYHIVSILIHIAAALSVWQLALRLFRTPASDGDEVSKRAPLLALGAALVFVAHPIQTQAVTYVAQRAALLATLFYAMSLTFYLEARLVQIERRDRRFLILLFSLSVISGLLALFSKEIAATLPIAMLMMEFFFLRSGSRLKWIFVTGVLVLFGSVVALLVSRNLISLVDTTAISRGQYLLTQSKVVLTYLALLVVPVSQSLDHFVTVSADIFDPQTFFSLLALVGFASLGVWLYSRQKVVSFGIFWIILTLLPESSIIPLKDLMFEHRLYLPMIGFSISSVFLLYLLVRRGNARRYQIVVGCYVAVLGSMAFVRNEVWKDDVTLWSDVISKSPMDPRAYHNRGRAYADRDMLNEALNDYSIAISLDPNFGPPHNNRASIYIRQQKLNEAIADCSEALRIGDVMHYQTARIYFNRATAYLMKNRIDSAFADFNRTIAYDPTHAAAYFNLGILYSLRGDSLKALASYTRCVSLNPKNSRAFNDRGVIFRHMGRPDSALSDFSRAIAAEPEFSRPYLNRGILLSEKGAFEPAIDDFTQFLKLSPNNFDGYYNRGGAYISMREFAQGIQDLNRALALNPSFGKAYNDRARAHIGLGQFTDAENDLQRAKSLGAAVNKELEAAARRGLGR